MSALDYTTAVNGAVSIITIIMIVILLIVVLQMRSNNKRMGWFLASVLVVMGGVTSEIMSYSSAIYSVVKLSSVSAMRSHIFYASVAPLFSLYFLETEREQGQKWDGKFWTTLQSLVAVLVSILAIASPDSFFMWFAFILQYVIVIVMLLISSKDIKASVGFVLGSLFPISAAFIGIADENIDVVGFGMVMMLVIVLFVYQSDVERELLVNEAELSESKVSLLMDQIHPHFIYNSLQQIALLCDEDASAVKPAILNFSGYLRRNLESLTNVEMIPFEKEMEHVDMFVELASISPSRNFTVEKKFGITDFRLPAITLQPLVENAVKYGIGMSTEGDKIVIETKEEKGYIVICVSDDGHGKKTELSTQKDHRSVGTKNVMTRLKLLCDGELIVNRTEHGTVSMIKIPIVRESENL